nr:T9SS type A sorting domain-containing protein [Rufibacter sp. XAAS-G3-1]
MAGEKLFPNPFTTSTTVIFVAKQRTKALVNVMDTSGKQVATLLDASVSPGTHSVTWHGTTASGSRLPGGVYFISVQVGSEKTTKRVALLNKL